MNPGVRQLHLRRCNRSLITLCGGFELIDQGLLLVEGLFGHAVVDTQQLIAFEVDQGDLQLGLVLPQLGLGLIEAGLDRAVIQGCQQVTGLDGLAFLDQQLGEDAVDLRTNHHAVQRQHSAYAADIVRHILPGHLNHPDRNRHTGGRFNGGRASRPPGAATNQGYHKHAQQDFFCLSAHAG